MQKLHRKLTLEKEHKDALERAVSLNIPHAVTSGEEESSCNNEEASSSGDKILETGKDDTEDSSMKEKSCCKNARTNWNEVVEKLFRRNESQKMLLKRQASESITDK